MKILFQSLLLLVSLTAISRADTVYVASFYGGYMNSYNSNGNGTSFAQFLSAPEQANFDATGNLYLANYGQSRIMWFDSSGSPFVFVTTPGGADGVTVGFDGNVYVADYDGGTIYKCPANDPTNAVVFVTNVTHAVALAFDNLTNLYVSQDIGAVSKFAPDGTLLGSITGLNQPAGLAIDRSGNLYVAEFGANKISKYSSSGTFVGNVGVGLSNPYMLAFDSKTNLFVTDYANNAVKEITPSGATSTFITLTNPSSLAVWPGLPVIPGVIASNPPPVVTNQPPGVTNNPPPVITTTNRAGHYRHAPNFTNLPPVAIRHVRWRAWTNATSVHYPPTNSPSGRRR